jgi:hypothetical protein
LSAGDIAAIVTAVVAVIALGGGYVQFVLRRSGLGYVEFDVEFVTLHRGATGFIGEIVCVIKNVGSSMVIVTNVQCRVRYRSLHDTEEAKHRDGVEPLFGHAIEPAVGDVGTLGKHSFWVSKDRTFIQPGVTQRYRKPIQLSAGVEVLNLLGSFDYRIETKGLTRALLGLAAQPPTDMDWREGIRLHTVRRSFSVSAGSDASESRSTEESPITSH